MACETLPTPESLEGHGEFSKQLILLVTVYRSEMTQTKITVGKGTKVRVLEIPEQDSSCPLSVESCRLRLALPAMTCDNTYEVWLTSQSLGVQGFY